MWQFFNYISLTAIILWIVSIVIVLSPWQSISLRRLGLAFSLTGTVLLVAFISALWIELERPPMRTMAETRLWYSLFMSIVTWFIYLKTNNKPMFVLGFTMSVVFLVVDMIHPEYQSKSLMPALQSAWFIPHVVVYMISYAILGAASVSTLKAFYLYRKNQDVESDIALSMQLVYPGFAFLTSGMLMGAFWAKIAWGNYWAWDPKETWALLTWFFYLILIHIHKFLPHKKRLILWLLALSFIVLIITWMGIKYLPSGVQSIHIYGG
ncbi:MAG TPA: cytochrome c biogenesis protein CcsA [Tenuifilaceae bacterium]|nr:cytochrome c biogenesis protein CcsA [Tenuifilaceae bacterium]HPE18692.1 cytochrome c biogenesis protein CcsA [Tenuifilaceae bacterium]HPJ45535.1 cytochrome c biogenesis protein CcsA [Tenuifilaceae bacterium]HPQ33811.1 cytochrome c biogenesis protein CcsA [Tenuifilaceae bacterium]HRX68623.1 cytochrome c biogenesis protein CcsA [Tenuifilaceae bacterium]